MLNGVKNLVCGLEIPRCARNDRWWRGNGGWGVGMMGGRVGWLRVVCSPALLGSLLWILHTGSSRIPHLAVYGSEKGFRLDDSLRASIVLTGVSSTDRCPLCPADISPARGGNPKVVQGILRGNGGDFGLLLRLGLEVVFFDVSI